MCEYCHQAKCPAGCPNHEPEVFAYCEYCHEPIYYGDSIYQLPDGTKWHEDCLWEECHRKAE